MTFREKIKQLMHTKKDPSNKYLVGLPAGIDISDVARFVDKTVRQENEDLKSEIAQMKAQEDDRKRQDGKAAIEEEQNILHRAKEHHDKMEIKKSKRMIAMQFLVREGPGVWKPPKNKPTFYLKDDKSFGKIAGVFLVESEEGYVQWLPMIYGPKGTFKMFNAGAASFEDFFRSSAGIVSQLNGGKLDSTFNVSLDGVPYHSPRDIFEIERDYGHTEKVRVIDISDQERNEYERRLNTMQERMNIIIEEYKQLKSKQDEYQYKSLMDSITSDVAQKNASSYTTGMQTLGEQTAIISRTAADILGMSSSSAINQKVSENDALTLLTALKSKEKTLTELQSKEENEVQRAQLVKDLETLQNLGERANNISTKDLKRIMIDLKATPKVAPPKKEESHDEKI